MHFDGPAPSRNTDIFRDGARHGADEVPFRSDASLECRRYTTRLSVAIHLRVEPG
jgi:hypothetical protein